MLSQLERTTVSKPEKALTFITSVVFGALRVLLADRVISAKGKWR